ncbi:unnamed protein product [Closterium sp. NIES-65]|nr:unnamed protein product [Closterium sp. NIES-65]
MKSVRKIWATSPDLSSFAHMNDWYDHQGEVSKQPPRVGVQWDMSLAEHSLPDGFCHVANSNARRYVVSRKADAIWAPLEIADGEGGIKLPFLVEFFFSHTRLGSMVGFEQDGAFRTSVVVEESLDTNERRPSDWVWPAWGLGGVPSHLPDHLPSVPALDDKTMMGTRTILTRNLMVQERVNVSWAEEWGPNSTAAAAAVAAAASGDTASAGKALAAEVTGAAAAAGFMGRVPEGDEERYAVFALPHGVVVCAPRSLQLVAGRPFVFSVSWVVGEGEVKRITASWGADGSFEKVEGELVSLTAPNTSAPSKSASSMASGGEDAAPFRQMSTEEHWWWGTPERLMTNWHGQWRCWKPLESTDAIRSFKSVRKFWATSPDRSSFAHMNDFYDEQGEVPKFRPPVGVQWDMSLAEHSLPDGFCHVAVGTARRHSVSREGDGIWGPLEVGDGAGGIKPFVEEFFFSHTPTSRFGCMVGFDPEGALRAYVAVEDSLDTNERRLSEHSPTSRFGCMVGYDPEGALRAYVVVEDSLETNERRPSDWVWLTWGPGGVPSQLPDHLPPVPALDDKTMVGTRTVLTRNLMVQERENVSWAEEWGLNSAAAAAAAAAAASDEKSVAADAAAAGFMGRVPEGDKERYAVFALPHGLVACAPRSRQLVAGRPFVLSVSWVVGEGEVKRITATWGAGGGFERVEGEWYRRQA